MNKPRTKIEWLVWGGLLLTIAGIVVAFILTQFAQRSGTAVSLPLRYPLPEFTLTNQDTQTVTLAGLRGHVWVADIIFTRCAGPCPRMTRQMSELQHSLPANDRVKWITLTTDPGHDTPAVLKQYGTRFGADFKGWMFLTGSKDHIVRLAVDGLKLITVEKKPEEREDPQDLFIHSTLFVVVDKHGRLRGSFESDDPELKQKIMGAVKRLLHEP